MHVKHAFNQKIQHILYFTINGQLGEMYFVQHLVKLAFSYAKA